VDAVPVVGVEGQLNNVSHDLLASLHQLTCPL
jgi:hypothetical protein